MGLRDKYSYAIQTSKGKLQGNAEERDGKLYFKGSVSSDAEKNEIWNAIKTIPEWQKEVVADIHVSGGGHTATATKPSAVTPQTKTYVVKAGDTLSKISKEQLGSANDYMKIFQANTDQLTNPDQIKPGQVLRIP
jgi:nucleoid-associated protein YgaU